MTEFEWMICNITGSLIVAMLATFLLAAYGERFNFFERVGIGVTGGTMILMIGPILAKNMIVSSSPFDDWAKLLLEFGIITSYLGICARIEGFAPASRLAAPPGEGWFNRRKRR